jgi:excisionase family DNA binding protein
MGIRFITKGEYISKYADTLLWLGTISTIFGLALTFSDGGLIIGVILVVIGISCIIGRIAFVVCQARNIEKANIDKIKLLCKCTLEEATNIYHYVERHKRVGELFQATEENKIVSILCQCTPFELHEKIPCKKLDDIFGTPKSDAQAPKKTYTCAEVAELCGVSVSTIRKWIRDGIIHATKYANMYIISEDDLRAYSKSFDPDLEKRLT